MESLIESGEWGHPPPSLLIQLFWGKEKQQDLGIMVVLVLLHVVNMLCLWKGGVFVGGGCVGGWRLFG